MEQRIGVSLKHYEFWLQDTQMLESHKNLVDQCVQGEGLVQINVQVQTAKRRINIADVLKPTDEVLESYQQELELAAAQAAAAAQVASAVSSVASNASTEANSAVTSSVTATTTSNVPIDTTPTPKSQQQTFKEEQETASAVAAIINSANAEANAVKVAAQPVAGHVTPTTNGSVARVVSKIESPTIIDDEDDDDDMGDGGQSALRWVCDTNFKRDQQRHNIPDDPVEWTVLNVKHWIQWAIRTFQLTSIKLQDWNISGKELCELDLAEFKQKVANDPGDLFWTHLELLRKCKFVAVVQKHNGDGDDHDEMAILRKVPRSNAGSRFFVDDFHIDEIDRTQTILDETSYCGNRSGNNGQIQLWQFLLEILTDKEHRAIIQWIGIDDIFLNYYTD